jgi:glycerol kinase
MSRGNILAIDAGTSSMRVILYDETLSPLHAVQREFTQFYPKPGYVEHDALEIFSTLCKNIEELARKTDLSMVAAIGITNQRETTVLWDESGKPVHKAIVWQCRRSAAICDALKSDGHEKIFYDKTGLVLDAYFSATKIRWLFDTYPDMLAKAKEGNIKFGTIDSYLLNRLTANKEHKTDFTNASRTLIYNIHEKQWDDDLLEILHIPQIMLPAVQESASLFGHTKNVPHLPDGIPILSLVGDQQASLAGNVGFRKGNIKNTYGTGCFMLMNTEDVAVNTTSGLLTTLACNERGSPCYALEGSVFMGGAVMHWLRDGLHIISSSSESESLAKEAGDIGELVFVPAFVGLGCPYWDQHAQAAILGIRRETDYKDIVKAALDGIAYQVHDVFREFETSSGIPIHAMRVDGGASKNDYLMQLQSDLLSIPLTRAKDTESTALGAAILAGMHIGMFDLASVEQLIGAESVFTPAMKAAERDVRIERWHKAVSAVRGYTALICPRNM